MSRGEISKKELNDIINSLPNLTTLKSKILGLHPDLISTSYNANSTIPIAIVCLKDALQTLFEANYALRESYAHKIWYKEKSQNNLSSFFFEKFYMDDVALRLYSAAEHLAYAIKYMLRISDKSLKKVNKSSISLANKIGKYLLKHRPDHNLSNAVNALVRNASWLKAINYRNDWVHNKPPIIFSQSIQWKRERRWIEIIKNNKIIGYQLQGCGRGDAATFTIDEIHCIMKEALFALVKFAEAVSQHYLDIIGKKGIHILSQ